MEINCLSQSQELTNEISFNLKPVHVEHINIIINGHSIIYRASTTFHLKCILLLGALITFLIINNVSWQDVNDNPPVFTSVPRPITLDDDIPIGTTVIDLVATDSDGTAPGNQVGVLPRIS